jgi:hypothetical protein
MRPSTRKKKPIFKRAWAIAVGSITFLGIILGVVTDGFQVWDNLNGHKALKNYPIIDIRVDPIEYNYNDIGDNYRTGVIAFTIQTSKGSYQLLDSIFFEKLDVIKPDFFVDSGKKPNSVLTEITIDNRILDNRVPEVIGLLKFKNDFILQPLKLKELATSKQKETIGIITFHVEYKFENEIYVEKKQIPLIVYYEDKKL